MRRKNRCARVSLRNSSLGERNETKETTKSTSLQSHQIMDDSDNGFMHNKKKRKRTAPDQLKVLEDVFSTHQHPNLLLRNQLAVQLGMTPRSVQIWFQNRRAKARNMEFTSSSSLSSSNQPASPSSPTKSNPSGIDDSVYKSIYISTLNPKVFLFFSFTCANFVIKSFCVQFLRYFIFIFHYTFLFSFQ